MFAITYKYCLIYKYSKIRISIMEKDAEQVSSFIPRFRMATKCFLNKKQRPETPPDPPMFYPPPKSVMKLTKSRRRYNAIIWRQLNKATKSISPRWIPVQSYSPATVKLPQAKERKVRMPAYIKGDRRTMAAKDDAPREMGFSEGSSESDFSDSPEGFQAPGARALAFGQALPELHEIITAYKGKIDLSKTSS